MDGFLTLSELKEHQAFCFKFLSGRKLFRDFEWIGET